MTILDKVNAVALDMNPAINNLKKCCQVSRTKAEIREFASEALEIVIKQQGEISKYRAWGIRCGI